MNTIKSIQRLNEEELNQNIPPEASWHADYKDSAYIYIGGLPFAMNEGDIVTVFSQCGEIVDCNLVRDPETEESKGFAFLAYCDQRSTVLAVDNFNAATICGRVIKVDHVKKYKVPKEYLENDKEENLYAPTGPDGNGWGNFKRLSEGAIKKHEKKIEDAEQKWEKEFINGLKKKNKEKKQKKEKKTHKKEKNVTKYKHKSDRQ